MRVCDERIVAHTLIDAFDFWIYKYCDKASLVSQQPRLAVTPLFLRQSCLISQDLE